MVQGVCMLAIKNINGCLLKLSEFKNKKTGAIVFNDDEKEIYGQMYDSFKIFVINYSYFLKLCKSDRLRIAQDSATDFVLKISEGTILPDKQITPGYIFRFLKYYMPNNKTGDNYKGLDGMPELIPEFHDTKEDFNGDNKIYLEQTMDTLNTKIFNMVPDEIGNKGLIVNLSIMVKMDRTITPNSIDYIGKLISILSMIEVDNVVN
jgi:hypothetical protein